MDQLSEFQIKTLTEANHAAHMIGDTEIHAEVGRVWLRGLLEKAFLRGVQYCNNEAIRLAAEELARRN